MKISEIREKLEDYYKNLGYIYQPSAPLIHDFFPMSFNMSAGFVQLEPYIHQVKRIDAMDIVTTQKCIRHFDLKKAGIDNSHATFFEMFGALTIGGKEKPILISNFFKLLLDLKIDMAKITVSVFGGDTIHGRFFSADKFSQHTWLELGLSQDQIFIGNGSNTFWFQGGNSLDDKSKGSPFETRLCGYQTEVFYDLTGKPCQNNCGPFCNCGRWLEIGNNLDIRYEYSLVSNQFRDLELVSTETVTGVERLAVALNNKSGIWELPEFNAFYKACTNLEIVDFAIQKIILDRIRALLFIASENLPEPGRNGRNRIVRKLTRDVLGCIYLVSSEDGYVKETLLRLITEVVRIYEKKYPELKRGSKTLFDCLLDYNLVFKKSNLHALSSINNMIARGELTYIGTTELNEFESKLGITAGLVKLHFQDYVESQK